MARYTDDRFATGYGVPRPKDVPVSLIVVHQTGNRKRGATAKMNLDHSHRTKGWSIHHIVDSTGIYDAVPHDQIAWHVAEPRIAEKMGYPISAPGRFGRGDIAAVGIEICVNRLVERGTDRGQKTIGESAKDGTYRYGEDGWPALFKSPSRTMRLDNATYAYAISCLSALMAQYPQAKVVGHGHLDPWTRNVDPFGVLPHGWDEFVDGARAQALHVDAPESPVRDEQGDPQPDPVSAGAVDVETATARVVAAQAASSASGADVARALERIQLAAKALGQAERALRGE